MTTNATHNHANVLIVEDEFLVALDLEDLLTEAGHQVVGIVSDHPSAGTVCPEPQVAFVDLNLRDGPTGTAIASDLSRRFGTSIIYVTANPRQIGVPAPTAIGYIQKPFSRETILAALAIAMHRDAPRRRQPGLELFPHTH